MVEVAVVAAVAASEATTVAVVVASTAGIGMVPANSLENGCSLYVSCIHIVARILLPRLWLKRYRGALPCLKL